MRYYDIKITNAAGKPVLPSSLKGRPLSSLNADGTTNPSALNVEFDIPFQVESIPAAAAMIRIWGLSVRDLSASLDLYGQFIEVRAGMAKGLPLANPKQQGLLLKGQILQSFGNWVGTDMTLDLNFIPASTPPTSVTVYVNDPLNIVWSWKANTPIGPAIESTLTTAFKANSPAMKIVIGSLSPKVVINHDDHAFFKTIAEFSQHLTDMSQSMLGGAYRGIGISLNGDTALVTDNSDSTPLSRVKLIAYEDLIGQPTWIGPQQISVKLVLRGDLAISDVIKLPKGPFILTPTTFQSFDRSSLNFNGDFIIREINHYGNFRQADAASWNTTVTAFINARVSGGQ